MRKVSGMPAMMNEIALVVSCQGIFCRLEQEARAASGSVLMSVTLEPMKHKQKERQQSTPNLRPGLGCDAESARSAQAFNGFRWIFTFHMRSVGLRADKIKSSTSVVAQLNN